MSYNTDNIAIAAVLRLNNFSINKIEINGKKAMFIFDDAASQLAHEVNIGSKLVDALAFHQELRRLSGLARSMTQRDNNV